MKRKMTTTKRRVISIPKQPSCFILAQCELLRQMKQLPDNWIAPYFQSLVDCGLPLEQHGTYHRAVAYRLWNEGHIAPAITREVDA